MSHLTDFPCYLLPQSAFDDVVELVAMTRSLALNRVRHHRAVTDGASLYEYRCEECLRAWTDDIAAQHAESCKVGKLLGVTANMQKMLDLSSAVCGWDDSALADSESAKPERYIEYGDDRIELLPEDVDEDLQTHVQRLTHEQAARLLLSAPFFGKVQR
jgi:hypothetical protein